MAKTSGADDRGGAADRPQDPLVGRLRPDPAQPPVAARTLDGLLGDSDRAGFRRLYFTAELDHYAEFRSEDVVAFADIPPDQPPFLGEPATRVTVRRDAPVDFTRTRHARPLDEFDLDVRLAQVRAAASLAPATWGPAPGCGPTWGFICEDPTAGVCPESQPITGCQCHPDPGGGGGGGTALTDCRGRGYGLSRHVPHGLRHVPHGLRHVRDLPRPLLPLMWP